MVALVGRVEGEHPDRPVDGGATGVQRARREVDERQPVGRGHAGDATGLGRQVVEPDGRGSVGGERHDVLAAGEPALRGQRREVGDRLVGDGLVRERDGPPGLDRADVQARAGQALGQRALAGDVRLRRAVDGRRALHVGQRRRWLVVHDDLVGRVRPLVGDGERDGHRRARGHGRGRRQLLGEREPAAERRRQDALHVDGQRGDGAGGERGARAVDEEQDAGEQPDAEDDAGQRREGAAGVADQVPPRVAEHGGASPAPPRRCRRRCGRRAARPCAPAGPRPPRRG